MGCPDSCSINSLALEDMGSVFMGSTARAFSISLDLPMKESATDTTVFTSMFGCPALHAWRKILHETVGDGPVNGVGSTWGKAGISYVVVCGPVVEASRATDSFKEG